MYHFWLDKLNSYVVSEGVFTCIILEQVNNEAAKGQLTYIRQLLCIVVRRTKEEETATVLLNLTRLSV